MNLPDRSIIPPELVEKYKLCQSEFDQKIVEFKRGLSEAERKRGKVSRNAKCPCGSGKKVKYCCLDKYKT